MLTELEKLNLHLLDVGSLSNEGEELERVLHGNIPERQLLLRNGQLLRPQLVPIANVVADSPIDRRALI